MIAQNAKNTKHLFGKSHDPASVTGGMARAAEHVCNEYPIASFERDSVVSNETEAML